jgi:glycosyltransferase involved in cell wall biosynthesis
VTIDVVVPARDAERTVGGVVAAIPRPPVRTIMVADSGSHDHTARVAHAAGAEVVSALGRGYGAACLAGLAALPRDGDVVVFLDAGGSDDPRVLPDLVRPILEHRADLVVGTRAWARAGSGAPDQVVGQAIAAAWLRVRFGQPVTDLGSFRAIRRKTLVLLAMEERGDGWMLEMHVKVARAGLRYVEVAVPCRRSDGGSTVPGTFLARADASARILDLLERYDAVRWP